MKTLKDLVLERLKLNKDTKINIYTKFTDDIEFTQNDVDIVQQYAQQMKVKPVILTNCGLNDHNEIIHFKDLIFIFFDNNWDERKQKVYLIISKSKAPWKSKNEWLAMTIINDKIKSIKNEYDYDYTGDIEDVCKELLKQLPNTDFYDEVKIYKN